MCDSWNDPSYIYHLTAGCCTSWITSLKGVAKFRIESSALGKAEAPERRGMDQAWRISAVDDLCPKNSNDGHAKLPQSCKSPWLSFRSFFAFWSSLSFHITMIMQLQLSFDPRAVACRQNHAKSIKRQNHASMFDNYSSYQGLNYNVQ